MQERVSQRIEGFISTVLRSDLANVQFVFGAVAADDAKARNTAAELDRIHNGTGATPRSQLTATALRGEVVRRIGWIGDRVRQLVQLPEDASQRRLALRAELRKAFSRRSPYTMLVRSYYEGYAGLRGLSQSGQPR